MYSIDCRGYHEFIEELTPFLFFVKECGYRIELFSYILGSYYENCDIFTLLKIV